MARSRPKSANLVDPGKALAKKLTALERRIRSLELRPDARVASGGGGGGTPIVWQDFTDIWTPATGVQSDPDRPLMYAYDDEFFRLSGMIRVNSSGTIDASIHPIYILGLIDQLPGLDQPPGVDGKTVYGNAFNTTFHGDPGWTVGFALTLTTQVSGGGAPFDTNFFGFIPDPALTGGEALQINIEGVWPWATQV